MKLKEYNVLLNSKGINLRKHTIKTLKSLCIFMYDKKLDFNNFYIKKMLDLLRYDFTSYDLSQRLVDIKNIGRSTSRHSMIIRYGILEGEKRYNNKIAKVKYTSSREFLMNKYDDNINIVNTILKNKCPNNIDTLKIKYPDSWKEKLHHYMLSYKTSNSLEGYIKKYGEEEGTKKWELRKINRKISNSLEGYIKKYGEEEGTKKWNDKSKKHKYRMSKQYYIDVYGTKIGEQLSKENSLFYKLKLKHGDEWFNSFIKEKANRAKHNKIGTKDFYINKYGQEKGNAYWETYITKQKYAHTLDYFIIKYGETLAKIKFQEHRNRLINNFINSSNGTSKISQLLFYKIKNSLDLIDCKFHNFNKEFYISSNEALYFYDFMYKNKIIEFNGDFWHMNPSKFKETDINKMLKITAKEIWEYDKIKHAVATSKGYDILTIWESDYYNNADLVFNKCINFLQNE